MCVILEERDLRREDVSISESEMGTTFRQYRCGVKLQFKDMIGQSIQINLLQETSGSTVTRNQMTFIIDQQIVVDSFFLFCLWIFRYIHIPILPEIFLSTKIS